ncbi:receptor-like protein EIX2 [Neltuma alba]|uniref:receptor-like protein EIX2 n=1 Tax=Neltuma alba TaxID=207710 RepID=UPI0010A4D810|nr:receptor-like protein EIX2 [Prosopis alba]
MDTSLASRISNLVLLWFLIFSITLRKGAMQCNERDHQVLLNFKRTLVDPSAILSTWSDERDCCEWEGVRCDNTSGRVIELSLPCPLQSFYGDCGETRSHCLTGELHLSLLDQLEFLNYLDLSNHDFRAIVGNDHVDTTNSNNLSLVERQNSSNLHYLNLSNNEDLHFDNLHWLSRVPSLEYLDLSGINLQGKLDWLQLATLLPALTELYFESCQLRNINPSLQFINFTSLEVLMLTSNEFSSDFFPNWLFNLSGVTVLNLRSNYFGGGFPEGLLNLQKTQELSVGDNRLSGPIPDWLGQLQHLQLLDLSENFFSGPVPSTLGNLSSLKTFIVRSNHLSGALPTSLGQLLNLEELDLSDNNLTGHVSERNFDTLSNLKLLFLGSPGLIFDFDPLWAPPFQLETIHLDHMRGPELPAWIYKQKRLSSLGIKYSRISFESQDNFWKFATQLAYLHLEDNTIDGEMSNVLLDSTIINLDSNKLKGNVPQLSRNVVQFSIANNYLRGSISPLVCQRIKGRTKLKSLDMSNNLLSGELPDCWMNWKSLVVLKLGGNNLRGRIPPSMSLLSNLTFLHLNKNNLFGEIPLSLKNSQLLQVIDLGENKFSGHIPSWIGDKTKVIRLRSNQLHGNIPPQICQLTSLIILDLADNKISGSIPTCLENMAAMVSPNSSYSGVLNYCSRTLNYTFIVRDEVLLHMKGQGLSYKRNLNLVRSVDLSSNMMSGTIPLEIFALTGLQSLNLSHNQFEGNIPKEIGNMKQLESVDLANNRLSGEIPQSMAKLSFLAVLNLSFNNFIGKIPLGTQLQGFDAQSYIGNPDLCGPPLQKNCTDDEDKNSNIESDNQDDEFLSFFYIGLGVGFAVAFWGVCGAIFLNRNFRHSYFTFLYFIRDKLYVMAVLMINRNH